MSAARYAATVVSFVATILVPAWASACSCLAPIPEEWLEKGTLVFRGRVSASERIREEVVVGNAAYVRQAERIAFDVLEAFKGPAGPSYSVVSGQCDVPVALASQGVECFNNCGVSGKIGEEYVVFAFANEFGADEVSMCSMFSLSERARIAQRCLKRLRKLRGRRTRR